MSFSTQPALIATRQSLHQLAERVISPVRVRATGNEISLCARPGGFGTKDLPDGSWVGVCGTQLVIAGTDGTVRRTPITSLREAAEFVGAPDAAELPDEYLAIDAAAARQLASAFDAGTHALEHLLATADDADAPSQIHLWPEHFDVAITLGDEAAGTRANYGVSPGDDDHPEPYAYVGPWSTPPGEGWNATGFTGAEAPATSAEAVLAFFQERRAALAG